MGLGVPGESLGVPVAHAVQGRAASGVVLRYGAVRVEAQNLARERGGVLGEWPAARLPRRHVQLAVGSEPYASPVVEGSGGYVVQDHGLVEQLRAAEREVCDAVPGEASCVAVRVVYVHPGVIREGGM